MKKNRLFNTIQINKPRGNSFDLSHEKKMSMDMGDLVPFFTQEVIPGDTFKVTTEIMMRLAPMIAPVMHRVNAYTHYFFVPNRLTFEDWEPFITGGEDGTETPAFPFINIREDISDRFREGDLSDFLGVPTTVEGQTITQDMPINALPFRAYSLIYNEYYRDQNLQEKIEVLKTGGSLTDQEIAEITTMRKRCWEKDYFTSCLPWSQRGGDVSLPVGFNYKEQSEVFTSVGLPSAAVPLESDAAGLLVGNPGDTPLRVENLEEDAAQVTINELRKAVRLQEWLEKNARAGSRYVEQIFAHFGIRSADSRLQRPEFLGGGRQPIVISEVLQTSQTDDLGQGTPQGTMAGHGMSVGSNNRFKKGFEEHGFIIGIMSVLPRTSYQQGLPRIFSKFDKFDYFWPEFAHLGEQEVLNGEIYHDWEGDGAEETFGYQSRYAEYKYKESTVHGDFKGNLSFWHMGRIFETKPALNASFVESDPTHRIFAVDDNSEEKLYVQLYNNVRAIRPIPTFGTPRL